MTNTLRILLVEDEVKLARFLELELTSEGYQITVAHEGIEGLTIARENTFDLVILDWMIPGLSGIEICRRLRSTGNKVPIILLTAKDEVADRVAGLDAGADDYVVKPFSPRELVARVRARLRRTAADAAPTQRHGQGAFAHDAPGQRVRYRGQWLALTRYEYQLLACLLARPGAILSREHLMDAVWSDAPDTVDRTVDTHIKTLRAKLRQAAPEADPIRTHRGLGYSLEPERPA